MLKFEILFDYKEEARRSLLYLIAPTLTTIATIFAFAIADWDQHTFLYFLKYFDRKFHRTIMCIATSVPFAIFIRSLYIRFAALNSLIRYHQSAPNTPDYYYPILCGLLEHEFHILFHSGHSCQNQKMIFLWCIKAPQHCTQCVSKTFLNICISSSFQIGIIFQLTISEKCWLTHVLQTTQLSSSNLSNNNMPF